jgi:hypothetical protein
MESRRGLRYGTDLPFIILPRMQAGWTKRKLPLGSNSKQCLGKDRIGTINELRQKTRAWNKAINKKKLKIQWGLSVDKAREIFKYG